MHFIVLRMISKVVCIRKYTSYVNKILKFVASNLWAKEIFAPMCEKYDKYMIDCIILICQTQENITYANTFANHQKHRKMCIMLS